MKDHDSNLSFENPYYNHALFLEHCDRKKCDRDLDFTLDLPKFSDMLKYKDFINLLHEVERVFYYKEVPDCLNVKLVAIKLNDRSFGWWDHLKQSHKTNRMRLKLLIERR